MRSSRVVAAAAAATVSVLGLQGCSLLSHLSTELAVRDDLSALLAKPDLTMRIGVEVTAAQLRGLSKQPVSAADVGRVQGTTIAISLGTGNAKPLRDYESGARDPAERIGIALEKGGNAPVQLLVANEALYARAQLPLLAKDFALPVTSVDPAQAALRRADRFIPGMAALADGSWVVAPRRELTAIADEVRNEVPASRRQDDSQSELRRMRAAIEAAFADHASLRALGKVGGRSEYRVDIRLAPVLEDLLSALPISASSTPLPISEVTKAVGNRVLVADLYASGGRLQELSVNLAQFASSPRLRAEDIPLIFDFSDAAPPAAPPTATPLNLLGLLRILPEFAAGASSSSSSNPLQLEAPVPGASSDR